MQDVADIDLSLFGTWPPGNDPPIQVSEAKVMAPERLGRRVQRVVLELKTAEALSPLEDYRQLLNDLTVEMREQFQLFRALRASAEALMEGADETAGKQARADAKAATDAMSLIVRTLEKIDSLQRQLARDRVEAQLREAESEDHEAIRQEFERVIEARAGEIAERLFRERSEGVEHGGGGAAGEPGTAAGARGP